MAPMRLAVGTVRPRPLRGDVPHEKIVGRLSGRGNRATGRRAGWAARSGPAALRSPGYSSVRSSVHPWILIRSLLHPACGAVALASYQPRVLLTTRTTSSITGTSISTPTTVARAAHRDTARPAEWALIEWPEGDAEPLKYFLCSLAADTPLERLVHVTKMRWRVERDYRELKQEFGLGQYEGRNWRGLHHHATLCIAAYGFLLWQRLRQGDKKKSARPQAPALPQSYRPRGSRANATACAGLDRHATTDAGEANRSNAAAMPVLRARKA